VSAEIAALTSGADQAYFEGLQNGEVRIQECSGCGQVHWPAVFRCPDCGSWDHAWKATTPEGTVYSWTRTWHDFGGPDAFKAPFIPVVVSLAEAPAVRLLGTLDTSDREVQIGSRVRAAPTDITFLDRQIPTLIWSLI